MTWCSVDWKSFTISSTGIYQNKMNHKIYPYTVVIAAKVQTRTVQALVFISTERSRVHFSRKMCERRWLCEQYITVWYPNVTTKMVLSVECRLNRHSQWTRAFALLTVHMIDKSVHMSHIAHTQKYMSIYLRIIENQFCPSADVIVVTQSRATRHGDAIVLHFTLFALSVILWIISR